MHIANRVLEQRKKYMNLHILVLESSKFDSKHVKQSFTKRIKEVSIEYEAELKQSDREFI